MEISDLTQVCVQRAYCYAKWGYGRFWEIFVYSGASHDEKVFSLKRIEICVYYFYKHVRKLVHLNWWVSSKQFSWGGGGLGDLKAQTRIYQPEAINGLTYQRRSVGVGVNIPRLVVRRELQVVLGDILVTTASPLGGDARYHVTVTNVDTRHAGCC